MFHGDYALKHKNNVGSCFLCEFSPSAQLILSTVCGCAEQTNVQIPTACSWPGHRHWRVRAFLGFYAIIRNIYQVILGNVFRWVWETCIYMLKYVLTYIWTFVFLIIKDKGQCMDEWTVHKKKSCGINLIHTQRRDSVSHVTKVILFITVQHWMRRIFGHGDQFRIILLTHALRTCTVYIWKSLASMSMCCMEEWSLHLVADMPHPNLVLLDLLKCLFF